MQDPAAHIPPNNGDDFVPLMPGESRTIEVPQEILDSLPTIIPKPRNFDLEHRAFLIHMGAERKLQDIPIKRVAKAIGISTSELMRWENGGNQNQSPTIVQVFKWARAIRYDFQWTINPWDEPDPNGITADEAMRRLALAGVQGIPVSDAKVNIEAHAAAVGKAPEESTAE